MRWHRVAEFPASRDLGQLSHCLKRRQYPHRFTIEGDKQALWTPHEELVEPLTAVIQDFGAGMLFESDYPATPEASSNLQLPQVYAPLTIVLLLLSFTGSALFSFGENWIQYFTFYDLSPFFRSRSAFSAIFEGQIWRLITPIFLHFGFIHIAFNAMWLWYLGARLEQALGSLVLLGGVILIGLISNFAQAIVSYPIPFGGMSGVVFGLLGFFWVVSKLRPHPELYMPPALFPIMIVLMLVSIFGVFDWMANAEVADTAHISGLVSGLLAGLGYSLFARRSDGD
jgi:GlpG protein